MGNNWNSILGNNVKGKVSRADHFAFNCAIVCSKCGVVYSMYSYVPLRSCPCCCYSFRKPT